VEVAATIRVRVVTPERLVWSGEATLVIARGADGDLGVLPQHAPLITFLLDAPVRIQRPEAPELAIHVRGGFLEVKPDLVTVLASAAELPGEVAEDALA
jgi:F-type H+-transporting ATPase subunit epsilon